MANREAIIEEVKNYLGQELVNKDTLAVLTENTSLIEGGLIDSISTMKLVQHLEETYHFDFEPHEVDKEYIDNLSMIADFVLSKVG